MSINVSDVFVAEYDKMVKHAWQAKKTLRKLVRTRANVEGNTVDFQKMSVGIATKKVHQADVVPMNVQYGRVRATMEDWNAPEYTEIFAKPKINFDEKAELVKVSANAIGRREDQIIIDALAEAFYKKTPDTPLVGAGDAEFSTALFRQIKRVMDYRNVDEARAIVMHTEALYSMLGDDDADTFDKNTVKMLVNGELSVWLGFDIYTIGYMPEGGLPFSYNGTNDPVSTTRLAFAFAKQAVGFAMGLNMRTEINYVAQKTSWLVNTLFSACCTVIDDVGIVGVQHKLNSSTPSYIVDNTDPYDGKYTTT